MNRLMSGGMVRVASLVAVSLLQANLAMAENPSTSTPVPVYQGTAFVTAVTSACTANGYSVGDYYTMLYRQLPESGNTSYGGGVAFLSGRTGVSYVMPVNTALNGGAQKFASVSAYGLSSKVGPYNYTGSFNLRITPLTLTATTPSVSMTGTVGNFFNNTGCTVTIRASLALRP